MKPPLLSPLFVILLTVACVVFNSCEDSTGPGYSVFHIMVDGLSIPDEIMQTDTLRIVFYATLPSCCYNFHRFEFTTGENSLSVKMMGRRRFNLTCCAPRKHIEETFMVDQLLTGYYYIEVLQPNLISLIDSVLVLR